jgi:hypothetical protein
MIFKDKINAAYKKAPVLEVTGCAKQADTNELANPT